MRHVWLWAAVCIAGLLAAPRAEACGGFFCAQAPINQAGERIVFGVRGNSVEAHIQIQYQGSADKFAWVVPVTAKPTLGIGSPRLFTFLDIQTQARFSLQWDNSCSRGFPWGLPGNASDGAESPTAPSEDGGVTVVSQEQVGPYDAAILTADDAVALRTWLTTNGYDIPESAGTALEPYVGGGFYFVALKLQQNKEVGDLRPIVVKFEGSRPCIPIKLTSIAAQPDMPIIAYVLSEKRAIPINYRHVLINPTRIDWLSGGRNYPQVATAAVDEAGGRAFLTEFAGSASSISQNIGMFMPSYDTSALARYSHPVDFAMALLNMGMGQEPTMQSLLRKYIPMPARLVAQGMPEMQFYNQLSFYRTDIDTDPGRAPFDAAGFLKEIQDTIVTPNTEALALVRGYPYLTRLYTTMSAEEMTVDPDFDFNSDAPDVSNVFTAKASFESCEDDFSKREVKITLPDGRYFYTRANAGPINQGPNALRIEQYAQAGAPTLIQDNGPKVNQVLDEVGGGVGGSCGCGSTDAGASALLAFVVGAWGLRRRRA